MAPFKSLNLRQTASRQEKNPEGSNGIFRGLIYLCGRQRLPKTLKFFRKQEPLTLTFWIAFDVHSQGLLCFSRIPRLGKSHHLRQDTERAICLVGNMRQRPVKLGDISRRHGANALLREIRIKEHFDRPSILGLGRAWRFRTRWTRAFASQRSTKRWRGMARQKYSTPIRRAVHQRRLHGQARGRRHRDFDGRTRSFHGQYFHRTVVALNQIPGSAAESLC
jgi:hypothetical protein